ncbi:unnamed protein product, partial [Musa acuminata var. zebrina]
KYQIFQISEISHCSYECLIKKVEVNFIKEKPKREDNDPIYNKEPKGTIEEVHPTYHDSGEDDQ